MQNVLTTMGQLSTLSNKKFHMTQLFQSMQAFHNYSGLVVWAALSQLLGEDGLRDAAASFQINLDGAGTLY